MKKTVACLLATMLLLAAVPALAGESLEVLKENFRQYNDEYMPFSCFYAKVQNKSAEPVLITEYDLDMKDADGNVLVHDEFGASFGLVLQPGEYTYAWFFEYEEGQENAVDCAFSYKETAPDGRYSTVRFESTGALEKTQDEWGTDLTMLVSVTNPTEEPLYDLSCLAVLLDAEDNILYISTDCAYDIGIAPGSTVTFRFSVPGYYLEGMSLEGLKVDSLALVDSY
ncbi:MAG: hypothetical protein K5919_05010 [Clostridiales bacterium]|nr:hypothetical protein [Clostridiales bacterium]